MANTNKKTSIAAFERTELFGQFSSRYDAYLAECLQLGGEMDDCAKAEGKAAKKAGNRTAGSIAGLGAVLGDLDEYGKFKVMTLHNIGLTAPYAHNGYFKTLKEIVHFYNTRDVPGSLPKSQDWPPPEVPETLNFDELGNLGLSC